MVLAYNFFVQQAGDNALKMILNTLHFLIGLQSIFVCDFDFGVPFKSKSLLMQNNNSIVCHSLLQYSLKT